MIVQNQTTLLSLFGSQPTSNPDLGTPTGEFLTQLLSQLEGLKGAGTVPRLVENIDSNKMLSIPLESDLDNGSSENLEGLEVSSQSFPQILTVLGVSQSHGYEISASATEFEHDSLNKILAALRSLLPDLTPVEPAIVSPTAPASHEMDSRFVAATTANESKQILNLEMRWADTGKQPTLVNPRDGENLVGSDLEAAFTEFHVLPQPTVVLPEQQPKIPQKIIPVTSAAVRATSSLFPTVSDATVQPVSGLNASVSQVLQRTENSHLTAIESGSEPVLPTPSERPTVLPGTVPTPPSSSIPESAVLGSAQTSHSDGRIGSATEASDGRLGSDISRLSAPIEGETIFKSAEAEPARTDELRLTGFKIVGAPPEHEGLSPRVSEDLIPRPRVQSSASNTMPSHDGERALNAINASVTPATTPFSEAGDEAPYWPLAAVVERGEGNRGHGLSRHVVVSEPRRKDSFSAEIVRGQPIMLPVQAHRIQAIDDGGQKTALGAYPSSVRAISQEMSAVAGERIEAASPMVEVEQQAHPQVKVVPSGLEGQDEGLVAKGTPAEFSTSQPGGLSISSPSQGHSSGSTATTVFADPAHILPTSPSTMMRTEPNPDASSAPVSPVSQEPIMPLTRSHQVYRNTILLQLEPPELGNVWVRVQQGGEQVSASFWAESSEARLALQSHLPALQEALAELGLPSQQISMHLLADEVSSQTFGPFDDQQANGFTYSQHQNRQKRRDSEAEPHPLFEEDNVKREENQGLVDIVI